MRLRVMQDRTNMLGGVAPAGDLPATRPIATGAVSPRTIKAPRQNSTLRADV
jgi:hypothetical protein